MPVDFYARDRTPTAVSDDTRCREFQRTVHLVREGGGWCHDPSGNSLSASVAAADDSYCPA